MRGIGIWLKGMFGRGRTCRVKLPSIGRLYIVRDDVE